MAGNISCNTNFLFKKNSVGVQLTVLIKDVSKRRQKLVSGMSLHKKSRDNIRYALSIKLSKQLLELLDRKNKLTLPNISVKNRNNTLEIRFDYSSPMNQLLKHEEDLLFIYQSDKSGLKFKFIGELYPALFNIYKSPKVQTKTKKQTLPKASKATTQQNSSSSSVIQEKSKYSNISSKVKTYFDPSVIEKKQIQPKKKVHALQEKESQAKLDQSNIETQRKRIEQGIRDKKGIYLSRSRWRNCENCLSLQKYNKCSVFKIEVENHNCCNRFYPITVTLGGGFSPR
ncbi:hypothetical protein ABID52_000409 [Fictibacillus halophilus]|uniref:Uncharacterized protein n=1 Tax=Fictibacillus halophilus TaxID=1610490 RepID=A0ABV2LH76_9BACL|nr:hypothetical protein [Fictibacillus halophilus]